MHTLSGPAPDGEYLWDIEETQNVIVYGSRTFRHMTRSNRLHRVLIPIEDNPLLNLDDGMDLFLFYLNHVIFK